MTVTDSAPAAAGDSPQSIRLTPLPAATPPPTLSSQPDRVPIPLRNFARRTPTPADMPRGGNNKKKKEEAAARKVSHTDSRISTAPALSVSCSTKGRGDDKIQTNGSLTFPLLSTPRCVSPVAFVSTGRREGHRRLRQQGLDSTHTHTHQRALH